MRKQNVEECGRFSAGGSSRVRAVRRAWLVPSLLTVGMLGWSAPASADPGPRYPIVNTSGTLSGYCPFDVNVNVLANDEVETFEAEAGGVLVGKGSGLLVVSVTNDSSGASLTLNISGPSTTVVQPDGTFSYAARGTSLYLWGPQAQAAYGLAPLQLVSGLVQVSVNYPTVTSYTATGHSEDICAALS